jgi:hypothetical protein
MKNKPNLSHDEEFNLDKFVKSLLGRYNKYGETNLTFYERKLINLDPGLIDVLRIKFMKKFITKNFSNYEEYLNTHLSWTPPDQGIKLKTFASNVPETYPGEGTNENENHLYNKNKPNCSTKYTNKNRKKEKNENYNIKNIIYTVIYIIRVNKTNTK